MLKPAPLKPGDTIGIAASSSPFELDAFRNGIALIEEMGFKTYYRADIFDRARYLAGSDKRRVEELIHLLEKPEVKAIFFARGGYGLLRLLPKLAKHPRRFPPKIILGYSDITSLLGYIAQEFKWVTFYGPVVAKDLSATMNQLTRNSLIQAITSTQKLGPFIFPETVSIQKGVAEGPLVGGCLSLVVASLGTPYEIKLDNSIVFFEDTNEKPYSVDRMLTQLVLAGRLDKAKGIIFGSFSNGGELDHFREVALDVLQDFKGPILFNFPAGHGAVKITLPLGLRVRLTSHEKKLEYLEEALNDGSVTY